MDNDIETDQRAWFDATDINANGDYTDNPTNNAVITEWRDKSGSANHISGTGTQRPAYKHNSLLSDRHGVDFDGADDRLTDSNDIWVGSVDQAESFVMATTDQVHNSALFSSTDNHYNRLSTHVLWGGNTFYDHGLCCSAAARMYRPIPITLTTGYVWHFIGTPSLQAIVRDGETIIRDSAVGIYTTTANSQFSVANWPYLNYAHEGRIFEAIFYQSVLNQAQRRINNSYLSAKWSRTLSSAADYPDSYSGDDGSNGHYDYFVGGIGQDDGKQASGTSQGLTITDDNFLNSDGKFLLAGVDYLLSAPTVGVTTSDLPSNYLNRSNRSWYLDTTGSGGQVELKFDANEIGIPINNGKLFGLLHRSGTRGDFSQVASSTMSSGQITFSHLPADGVYTVGKINTEVALSLIKTADINTPNIGDDVTFTLTVSNDGPADATNASIQDAVPAGFGNITQVISPIGASFTITGNTIAWNGINIPVGESVTAIFTAEVLPP